MSKATPDEWAVRSVFLHIGQNSPPAQTPMFGSANGTCSCNICHAAKAARPFLTIEDLSHQPHLPPLLHFPAGPQQTLTFCDA